MTEDARWVAVTGYEGLYEVSDSGIVRSLDRRDAQGNWIRGRVLLPDVRPSGHFRVTLCRESKTERFWVHRLVLSAFVGPRPPEMEGCHNDGVPANNAATNLRWDTKKGNAQDRRKHGTDSQLRKTHCPHGHEYSPDNTYYDSTSKWRHCRTCSLASNKRRRDRIRLQKA